MCDHTIAYYADLVRQARQQQQGLDDRRETAMIRTKGGPMFVTENKWDIRILKLAREIASWSKDPSTQVGAVIVDAKHRIIGTGYNGFPRGVHDLPERYADRPTKYKMVVHAEVNAVVNSVGSTQGATIYVWPGFAEPNVCNECAKVLIQAGIAHVVGPTPNAAPGVAERWSDSIAIAHNMLIEAGVTFESVDMGGA
jgi:dCMP deaminase